MTETSLESATVNFFKPVPLTRTRRDGGVYVREATVEAQIQELSRLPQTRRRERLTRDVPRGNSERLREETLVWALRASAASGDTETAWTIAEILTTRVSGHVNRQLARWRLGADDTEDCVQDLFAALYDALFETSSGAQFWEVRFWVCLDRRLWNLVERRQTALDLTAPDSEGDGFGEDEGETRLMKIADMSAGPEAQVTREMALAELTELEKRAIFLRYVEGLPEESENPERSTVAKLMGVSGRTVRNYLRRAERKLREWEEK